ncbi:hypothetical protein [Frigidibacter sp. SD6-1]|uniref:hypothetical protein n=1 Tax=Frigidibacter sp. SD6-1 TaxID=3032581 RepID=UPI0024DF36CF|nr:hypothetical protein [Frigidibacter sp. SD6-1]
MPFPINLSSPQVLTCLLLAAAVPGMLSARDRLVLLPGAELAPAFDALPRLVGSDAVALSINADLARVDAEALEASADCRARTGSDWARFISVAFTGPRFLSLSESHDFYCAGAAHPDSFARYHTYDLTTGARVNWAGLLPPSLIGDARESEFGTFAAPELSAYYLQEIAPELDADCRDELAGTSLSFQFSLDAATQALQLQPEGLAHAVRACWAPLALSVDRLEAMGADATLTGALRSAFH